MVLFTLSSISFQPSAEVSSDSTRCCFGSRPLDCETSPRVCRRASVLDTSPSGSAFATFLEEVPKPLGCLKIAWQGNVHVSKELL